MANGEATVLLSATDAALKASGSAVDVTVDREPRRLAIPAPVQVASKMVADHQVLPARRNIQEAAKQNVWCVAEAARNMMPTAATACVVAGTYRPELEGLSSI